MRGLVLVDVDNVLNGLTMGRELDEFRGDAAGFLRACSSRVSLSECIVAFALNVDSGTSYGLTFAGLRSTANALASALAAGTPQVEIGLTLTMPQAADVLLERLARESPTGAGAGEYGFLAVLSDDGALVDSMREFLRQSSGNSPWRELSKGWQGAALMQPAHRNGATRRPQAPVRVGGCGEPPANTLDHTIAVSGHSLAAWAAARAVDLPPATDLPGLASLVDREPWLLSQVGATLKSLRGLARTLALPGQAPLLGSVSKDDGLEVRGSGQRPTVLSDPKNSTVGIGAVRGAEGATVATRVPASVLREVTGKLQVTTRGILAAQALQALRAGAAVPSARAKVVLQRRGSDLVALVHHHPGHQPAIWWVRDSKADSVLRIRAPGLLPTDLEVDAISMRNPGTQPERLAMRSPVAAGAIVRIESAIAPGEIGQALGSDPNGREVRLAVLAPQRPLPAGSASVAPIHTLARTGLVSKFPERLWVLPLVVAQ